MMEKLRMRSTGSTEWPAYPSQPGGRPLPVAPSTSVGWHPERWVGRSTVGCYPQGSPEMSPAAGTRGQFSRCGGGSNTAHRSILTRTTRTSSGKHQEPDQAESPDHQAPGPQQGGAV